MKIVAGMGSIEDYEGLVEAGADEVFCGFVPNSWNLKYRNVLPLNRREVLFYHVQIGTYEDMKILWKKMDEYQVPVTVAFNALYYTKEQLNDVMDIIERLNKIGFKEYIIADVNLIRRLLTKNIECKIHVSGELGEWNTKTIKLFNEKLKGKNSNISRIIFHRKNLIEDMKSCTDYGISAGFCNEYEAFCMNESCQYTGGFCNSLHTDEMVHICQLPYEVVLIAKEKKSFSNYEEEELDNTNIPGESGCGLCSIYNMKEAGVTHLKVVGRGKSPECMLRDVRALRNALNILEKSTDEEDFKKQIIKVIFDNKCSKNCYYQIYK